MTWAIRLFGSATALIVLVLLCFAAGADSLDAVAPTDTSGTTTTTTTTDTTTTDTSVAPADSWVGIWVDPIDLSTDTSVDSWAAPAS
jgi:hypothetical protein